MLKVQVQGTSLTPGHYAFENLYETYNTLRGSFVSSVQCVKCQELSVWKFHELARLAGFIS